MPWKPTVSGVWCALQASGLATAEATAASYTTRLSSRGSQQTYADKDRQEALIRESSLDWIIVRPASFNYGPQRGNLRAELT
jgi:uncharacterized protein YbjT (DUF2867 family)